MPLQVVLLRGINIGPHKRVAMGELRELLSGAGFTEVASIAQSGSLVLGSDLAPAELEQTCERLIAERFGFEVPVITRTGTQMARVVAADLLGEMATNPKRYQVSFLSAPLSEERLAELQALATKGERLAASGRELFAWHPDGVARSKLWAGLADSRLGVKATARNWNTVTALAEMASA